MKNLLKPTVINLLKFLLVAALLCYMLKSGKLDLEEIPRSFSNPLFLLASFSVWFLGSILFGSLRWYLLLSGADINVPFLGTMRLQAIGSFFNVAMPGSVSGDIVKAFYVLKSHNTQKSLVTLTLFLDRITGAMGLFLVGLIACFFNFNFLWLSPTTQNFVIFLSFIVLGVGLFLGIVYSPHDDKKDLFLKILDSNFFGFSLLKKFYIALRSYRKKPLILFSAIIISVLIQFLFLVYTWFIAAVILHQKAPFGVVASVYPFAILTTAIPLAPGGIGVGHVAFERLFELVGIAKGAVVFNFLFLGPLFFNLLGFIPYVFTKTKVTKDNLHKTLGDNF